MLVSNVQSSFHRKITYTVLSWSVWANIAQEIYLLQCWHTVCASIAQGDYLSNVSPWLIDNFYEESDLYNVVSTMLGQHCIRILSSQCCPNTSETTLHKKTICPMLDQSAQTCFRRKTVCRFKCFVACFLTWYNITEQSWLFLINIGSGVHLRLAGQQWTGVDIDWNSIINKIIALLPMYIVEIVSPKTWKDYKNKNNFVKMLFLLKLFFLPYLW